VVRCIITVAACIGLGTAQGSGRWRVSAGHTAPDLAGSVRRYLIPLPRCHWTGAYARRWHAQRCAQVGTALGPAGGETLQISRPAASRVITQSNRPGSGQGPLRRRVSLVAAGSVPCRREISMPGSCSIITSKACTSEETRSQQQPAHSDDSDVVIMEPRCVSDDGRDADYGSELAGASLASCVKYCQPRTGEFRTWTVAPTWPPESE
jgi:hypothetical protein